MTNKSRSHPKIHSIPQELVGKMKIKLKQKSTVNAETGCWELKKAKSKGYGVIVVKGSHIRAHRLSYMVHIGEIPPNLFICHKCDNPKCVNPEHLFAGTHSENMLDAFAKGRLKIPSYNDRRYTDDQINEIRSMYAHGYTDKQIAEKFGDNRRSIFNIVWRKSYTSVPDLPPISMDRTKAI